MLVVLKDHLVAFEESERTAFVINENDNLMQKANELVSQLKHIPQIQKGLVFSIYSTFESLKNTMHFIPEIIICNDPNSIRKVEILDACENLLEASADLSENQNNFTLAWFQLYILWVRYKISFTNAQLLTNKIYTTLN